MQLNKLEQKFGVLPDSDTFVDVEPAYIPINLHLTCYGGCDWWITTYSRKENSVWGFSCLFDNYDRSRWHDLHLKSLCEFRFGVGKVHTVEFDDGWVPCMARDVEKIRDCYTKQNRPMYR